MLSDSNANIGTVEFAHESEVILIVCIANYRHAWQSIPDVTAKPSAMSEARQNNRINNVNSRAQPRDQTRSPGD